MAADRYVVLGLAQARSGWFRAMARWTTSGTLPVEFVKCVSAEELRARLASGRPFSAVLIDGSLPALDRDLVEAARAAGCAVVAVDDRRGPRDWTALGVADVLPEFFDPRALLDSLRAEASTIARSDELAEDVPEAPSPSGRGQVALVCGPGGTGASTVAIALAQGLAAGPTHRGGVLLADLARHAEQAMLHDARDVVPGVQELVEAHRSRRHESGEVRSLTFHVQERGYHLLLGLRRAPAWAAMRPRAFGAAFDALVSAFGVVVCDADPDFEGENEGGSIEVEERNLMARTAASRADAVFVVGLPGMKGLHSLVRVLRDVADFGVPSDRVVPVLNRAPRSPGARAELTAALAALAGRHVEPGLPGPIFLPDRRVEDLLHDGLRLPPAITEPLAGAFAAVAGPRPGRATPAPFEPTPVRPGTLGSWADDSPEEAAFG